MKRYKLFIFDKSALFLLWVQSSNLIFGKRKSFKEPTKDHVPVKFDKMLDTKKNNMCKQVCVCNESKKLQVLVKTLLTRHQIVCLNNKYISEKVRKK